MRKTIKLFATICIFNTFFVNNSFSKNDSAVLRFSSFTGSIPSTSKLLFNHSPAQSLSDIPITFRPSLAGAIESMYSPKPMFVQLNKANTNISGEAMPNITTRAIIAGALFVPTIITGYITSNQGKPQNTLLVAGHKITATADLLLLNYTVYQRHQFAKLDGPEIAATIFTNLCYAATIATGALLTSENQMPHWVNSVHSVMPWLTILSSAVLLYVLNN